ncbi:MAG: fibronectin type III-like domain-contianing protein, partial [Chthoniobacteraceae bacterium]
LKGFVKAMLQPGETKSVEVLLSGDAFAFWSTKANGWVIEEGEFVIEAGTSSRTIVCVEQVSITPADF